MVGTTNHTSNKGTGLQGFLSIGMVQPKKVRSRDDDLHVTKNSHEQASNAIVNNNTFFCWHLTKRPLTLRVLFVPPTLFFRV